MSVWEYIKYKLKLFLYRESLTLREKFIRKCENILFDEIEILKILRSIQNITKLKAILLNPSQLDLFEFLAKPMIYLGDPTLSIQKKANFLMSNRMSTKRLDEITKAYQEIKTKNEKSPIDTKILELLDVKLKSNK